MTDVLPILPRELTDLPEEVRMVPPPPTPQLREPFSIRLVEPDADTEMIAEWMNRPHLVETWEYDRPATW